jgi:asparagine N-glycosylation enzyme membrane subunit Stt3
MLSYTRSNLASTDVVASWWDYGNWLSIFGNVTTLCDNTTVNGTQIENVGYAMMANETQSILMLKSYDAKYVLVFVVGQLETSNNQITGNLTFSNYGDEGKWARMARISGGAQERFMREGFMTDNYKWANDQAFGNYSIGYDITYTDSDGDGTLDAPNVTESIMGQNSTIYSLMTNAMQQWATANGFGTVQKVVEPEFFNLKYLSGLDISYTKSMSDYYGLVPLVALYEIDYDAYNNATSTTP